MVGESGTAAAALPLCFQVVIVTHEPLTKVGPVLASLAQAATDRFHVVVLTGAQSPGPSDDLGPRVTVAGFPGESVFHLRSRIPELTTSAEWAVILEDHNLVAPDWADRLLETLLAQPPEVAVLIGAATNDQSTDPWSYANFLSVLGFHWWPSLHAPLEPLGFNIAFRRSRLPARRFELGAYEVEFMPGLMPLARGSTTFPVDHRQVRLFPGVLAYHWANGRVTGAFMRRFVDSGFLKVLSHGLNAALFRQMRLRRLLRTHPRRGELPRGSLVRVQMLAVAHAFGAVFGGLFGAGRAPWELE